MKLDIKMIEELAKGLHQYNLESLDLELGNEKIRLKKKEKKQVIKKEEGNTTNETLETKERKTSEEISEIKEKKKTILSPMLGTFYQAKAPGEAALVKEGDRVEIGDTLCIVEAMKMMNEVKSTEAGVIEKILVEDGIVVQKDQVLFEIK